MKWWKSISLLLVVAGSGQADPVAAALEDAKRLPYEVAFQTRYLTYDTYPKAERVELRNAGDFWSNGLSSSPDITRLRLVGTEVLAIYLPEYGWKPETWDQLAFVDPYYTVRILTSWPGGRYSDGKTYAAGSFNLTRTASAPWLNGLDMAGLYRLTGSKAPILRADWFLAQVAIQDDRRVGYYDFLGVGKKRADFEAIVGLDRTKAIKLRKEIAAIVDESIVALHNRQFERLSTLNGAYWASKDVFNNRDQRNALRFLDKDYKHDAEEIYGTLPNGLFAFYLSDAAGNRANTAPDSIASDGRTTSTDRRVHVGLSCVRCHIEGIRPINCWARRAYSPPDELKVTDPIRFLRLRQLYLSDLDKRIKDDQDVYAYALLKTNGLTPGDNAKVIAAVWERYVERPLTADDVAREMGTTVEQLRIWIKDKEDKEGILDPILLALSKEGNRAMTLRREYVEEMWPVLMRLKK